MITPVAFLGDVCCAYLLHDAALVRRSAHTSCQECTGCKPVHQGCSMMLHLLWYYGGRMALVSQVRCRQQLPCAACLGVPVVCVAKATRLFTSLHHDALLVMRRKEYTPVQ